MIDVLMDKPSQTGEDLKYELNQSPHSGWVNWTGRRAVEMLQEGKVLNAHSRTDKLAQLTRLGMMGVRTVPFSLELPERGHWLARSASHQQGRDLTTKKDFDPDFYTQYISFDDEWRIHVFRQNCGKVKVLRSGLKLPSQRKFHPWVKSHRLGWRISYVGGAPEEVKKLARSSIEALQLDFGAVDIGVDTKGTPYVLEVNTCPGLEGGTLEKYLVEIEKRFEA